MIKKLSKIFLITLLFFNILSLNIDSALANNEVEPKIEHKLLIADAGPNRFAKVASDITLDGSLSYIPEGIEPIYRWDMGNSEFRYGMRISYAYKETGTYRLKLTIEGKNTEFKSVDEAVMRIFDKQILLFSSSVDSSDIDVKKIKSFATLNNIATNSIRLTGDYTSDVSLKKSFADFMLSNKKKVEESQIVVVIGEYALESFLSFYHKSPLDLSDKKMIFITTDLFFNKPRIEIAKIVQNATGLSKIRIEAIDKFDTSIFDFNSGDFSGYEFIPQKNRYNLGFLDFLYRFNLSLIEKGFSLDIVYFLYVMLLISIFGLFLRKILGLAVVSIHILGLTIFSFIILGLVPSLLLFTGFFVVSYLVQRVYETDRDTLFSGSFVDMLMMMVFIVAGFSIFKLFMPTVSFDISNFVAIIIISIASRRLARYTVNRPIYRIIIQLIQDLSFLAINSFILTIEFIRLSVLAYPEFYIFFIVIASIIIEKYMGLRLMELIRFRKLLGDDNYLVDKREE